MEVTSGPDAFGDEEWLPPDEPGPAPWSRFARPLRLLLPVAVIILAAVAVPSVSPVQTGSKAGSTGSPPMDRQLLWFVIAPEMDPLALHLRSIDWHGTPLGFLTIPCRGPCSLSASPDGRRLLVYEEPPRGEPAIPGIVYDVRGQYEGTVLDPPAVWADDSRHLCKLRPTAQLSPRGPSQAFLEFIDPSRGLERLVGSVGGVNDPATSGFWTVLACSATTDRAVVAFGERFGIHNLRVIRLSDGDVLYRRDDLAPGQHCGCPVVDMAVSSNAQLATENLRDGGVRVRDFSTGATVLWPPASRLARSGPILSLSWWGRLAVTPSGVIELTSGRLIWRPPANAFAGPGLPRPGTDDLLLYESNRDATSGGPRDIVVQSNGQFIELPFVDS